MRIRAKRGQLNLTPHHVHHLAVGRDFFGQGFDTDLDAMRAAWRSPEFQEQVWQVHRSRWGERGRPWAAVAFDDGVVGCVDDIPAAQSRYWELLHPEQALEAVRWARETGRITEREHAAHMARLSADCRKTDNP
jgi:hypothetical protein